MHTSIVIPCFNAEKFIKDAVDSAVSEGVEGERLIVVNDGSTDSSLEVLHGLAHDFVLKSVTNGGASKARNLGLSLVKTKYVMFLDADDYYAKGFVAGLERQAEADGADLTLGRVQNICLDGKFGALRSPPTPDNPDRFLAEWLGGKSVQTNAQHWKTDFLRTIGGWNESMKRLEEIEHVARAILAGARVALSHDAVAYYRHHDSPERLSYGDSEEILESMLEAFEALLAHLGHNLTAQRAIGEKFYTLARNAYRNDYRELGHRALAKARTCRFRGHVGTSAHRWLASIFGLYLKERLSRLL